MDESDRKLKATVFLSSLDSLIGLVWRQTSDK